MPTEGYVRPGKLDYLFLISKFSNLHVGGDISLFITELCGCGFQKLPASHEPNLIIINKPKWGVAQAKMQ